MKFDIYWKIAEGNDTFKLFALFGERYTLEEADVEIKIDIDIQEDGGDLPRIYRICNGKSIIKEIDASKMTREERLSYVPPEIREGGKQVAKEEYGLGVEVLRRRIIN